MHIPRRVAAERSVDAEEMEQRMEKKDRLIKGLDGIVKSLQVAARAPHGEGDGERMNDRCGLGICAGRGADSRDLGQQRGMGQKSETRCRPVTWLCRPSLGSGSSNFRLGLIMCRPLSVRVVGRDRPSSRIWVGLGQSVECLAKVD